MSDCGCGRQPYYLPFADCPNYGQPLGPYVCNAEPVLTQNFQVPFGFNQTRTATVSNTSRLFVGQGVRIGNAVFSIFNIPSATTINITYRFGGTPGEVLAARSEEFGCFDYPIIPLPAVTTAYTPAVAVFNTAGTPVAGLGAVTNAVGRAQLLGMTTWLFNVTATVEITSSVNHIGLTFPAFVLAAGNTLPEPVPAVRVRPVASTTYTAYQTKYLVSSGNAFVGPYTTSNITNNTYRIDMSGTCEVPTP